MDSPRVLVRGGGSKERRPPRPSTPEFGWALLGLAGGALLLAGLLDLGLAIFPAHFGDAQWEFGTIGSVLNGLPVPVLGLTLLLGASVARGWVAGARFWAVVAVILAVLILATAAIWALNIPLSLSFAKDEASRLALTKSISKTTGQAVIYPVALLWMGVASLRRAHG